MIGKFHDSDFPIEVHAGNFEHPAADFLRILRILTVITAEILSYFFFSIHLAGKCARHDLSRLRLASQRAGQFADRQLRRTRRGSFVLCIMDPHHVSRMLYQSVLKAASGSNKRPSFFSGKPDCFKYSGHAPVWASGSAEKWQHTFSASPCRLQSPAPARATGQH